MDIIKRIKDWWIKQAYGCECKYWGFGSCGVCAPFTEEKLNWKYDRNNKG